MARLQSASIRLVQKMNRQNKNGEYPIYLVVCWHGRMEKSCGVSCLPRYWDASHEVIKRSCPNAPILNKLLNDIKGRCIERKNDYEYRGKVYTASMLISDVVVDFDGSANKFIDLMNRLIEERRLRDGTARRYSYCYRKLCEYIGRNDFIVDELDLGMVKDFALWLERTRIKINTIKTLLCSIAAVWNYAIQKKVVDGEGYPFNEFKYTSKYKECPRDYYLEKGHIVRLRDYWMDLVIERKGNRWTYREGVLDKLHQRWSKEFGILWFLLCYKLNGSSPIDVALIRPSDCKPIRIGSDDYWAIDIRRKKTDRAVNIRWKRDVFCQIALEHFLGFCNGRYVYPIIYWKEGISDRQILEQSHKNSVKAMKWVRRAFEEINVDIARDNAVKGLNESVVDIGRIVMYTARHSFSSNYINSPNTTIGGLAQLLARSPNTIATYVHQLTKDEDIALMTKDMPI